MAMAKTCRKSDPNKSEIKGCEVRCTPGPVGALILKAFHVCIMRCQIWT